MGLKTVPFLLPCMLIQVLCITPWLRATDTCASWGGSLERDLHSFLWSNSGCSSQVEVLGAQFWAHPAKVHLFFVTKPSRPSAVPALGVIFLPMKCLLHEAVLFRVVRGSFLCPTFASPDFSQKTDACTKKLCKCVD